MSNIYKGVDLSNALAHYGRKGMRRGRHLAGTTWWQKSLGRKSGGFGAYEQLVKDKKHKIERDKEYEKRVEEKGEQVRKIVGDAIVKGSIGGFRGANLKQKILKKKLDDLKERMKDGEYDYLRVMNKKKVPSTSGGPGNLVKKGFDDFKIKKEAADEIEREKDEKKKIEDFKRKLQDPFKRKDGGFADLEDYVHLKMQGVKHKRWRVIQEKVKQQKETEKRKKLKEMQRKFNPWK